MAGNSRENQVCNTVYTYMAMEEEPKNVGQSRKHLDLVITLNNEDICSLSSVF